MLHPMCHLVPLERLYKKLGLPVKNYPRSVSLISEDISRVANEKQTHQCAPPCLYHMEEDSESRSPRRPLKQTYAQAGM